MRRVTARPTIATILACLGIFALQEIGSTVGIGSGAFALSVPLGHQPWTIVTSVYAHAGIAHLIANSVAVLVIGSLVARVTTPGRFHAFFITTGAIAGVIQVLVAVPFGGIAVLGASGSVFALLGYALVGNRASERALAWLALGRRARVGLLVLVAALLTAATAAPGVALVAHFAGFCLGAGAGRFRLLHVDAGS
jgi:membrane associated rhomboid family serine protease